MKKLLRAATPVMLLAAIVPLSAATPRETAAEKYRYARVLLEDLQAAPKLELGVEQYQLVVDAFQSVVKVSPVSSYCDDALLATGDVQAAMAARFDSPMYRNRALDTYRFLIREYPHSSLIDRARESIRRLQAGESALPAQAADPQEADQPDPVPPQEPPAPEVSSAPIPAPAVASEPRVQPVSARSTPAESSGVEPLAAFRDRAEPSPARLTSGTAGVRDVRYWTHSDYTRIVIELTDFVPYKFDFLSNPRRVYFDLYSARLTGSIIQGLTATVDSDPAIKQIRVAQNRRTTARLVADLADEVNYNISWLSSPPRLVIELRSKSAPALTLAKAEPPATPAPVQTPQVDARVSQPGFSDAFGELKSPSVRPVEAPPVRWSPRPAEGRQAPSSQPLDRSLPQPIELAAAGLSPTLAIEFENPTLLAPPPPARWQPGAAPAPGAPSPRAVERADREPVVTAELRPPASGLPIEPPSATVPQPLPDRFIPQPVLQVEPLPRHVEQADVEPYVAPQHDPLTAPPPAAGMPTLIPPPPPERWVPQAIERRLPAPSVVRQVGEEPVLTAYLDPIGAPEAALPTLGKLLPPPPPPTAQRASEPLPEIALAPPKEAAAPSSGDRSLIRALGLKVGRVVIDAGHGGHDPGNIGPTGLQEKTVVLDVALRLGKLIEKRLGAEVIYTRDSDRYPKLEERTALANAQQADLFISVHANSSTIKTVRGVETFYLNFTSDPWALKVAARENAASDRSVHELQDLLSKIALKEKIDESREFAGKMQTALYGGLATTTKGLRNRGVRQAPFMVLVGAKMPAILAEIGFLSNATDEKLLKSTAYREKVAEFLFDGVEEYVDGLGVPQLTMTEQQTASAALD